MNSTALGREAALKTRGGFGSSTDDTTSQQAANDIHSLAQSHALGHGANLFTEVTTDATGSAASLLEVLRIQQPVARFIVQARGCNVYIWTGDPSIQQPADTTGTLNPAHFVVPDGVIQVFPWTGEPSGFYLAGDAVGAQITFAYFSYGG